jgi:hypothetical protein
MVSAEALAAFSVLAFLVLFSPSLALPFLSAPLTGANVLPPLLKVTVRFGNSWSVLDAETVPVKPRGYHVQFGDLRRGFLTEVMHLVALAAILWQ